MRTGASSAGSGSAPPQELSRRRHDVRAPQARRRASSARSTRNSGGTSIASPAHESARAREPTPRRAAIPAGSLTYDVAVTFASVEELERALRADSYLADRGLATAIYLALRMRRPLLLEGEAGVGKTEVAKTLARALDAELIRLQCYEGIDASQALYEWDYSKQLLYARALQEGELDPGQRLAELHGPEFLLERPLLRALRIGAGAVLLIDELDRADDEFEAFLLELLSDFTVTVPEVGTFAAEDAPAVV